jgi:hypothetical protein
MEKLTSHVIILMIYIGLYCDIKPTSKIVIP